MNNNNNNNNNNNKNKNENNNPQNKNKNPQKQTDFTKNIQRCLILNKYVNHCHKLSLPPSIEL